LFICAFSVHDKIFKFWKAKKLEKWVDTRSYMICYYNMFKNVKVSKY